MSKIYWENVCRENLPSSLDLDPVIYEYLQQDYKILDIGCGFGKVSLQLATLGYSVTGIDLNPEAIKFSKTGVKTLYSGDNRVREAEFQVANASKLPFSDESFEFAIMQAFLTSVPTHERKKIIKEAYRILKQAGYLYLVDFTQNWHLKLYRDRYLKDFLITREEGSFLALDPETGEVEYVAHHFSEKELVCLLVNCGFEIDYFKIEELKTRSGNKINGFVIVAKKP